MGRFVGTGNQRSTGSGGGSGDIVKTSPYNRSTGLTTNTSNNVTAVTLGENSYNSIQYDSQGRITGYNEIIGSDKKGFELNYDSVGLITSIVERESPFPVFSVVANKVSVQETGSSSDRQVQITLTAEDAPTVQTQYYVGIVTVTALESDFVGSGTSTISLPSGNTAIVEVLEDESTEGSESFKIGVYTDSARTNLIAETDEITISDTSVASAGGAIFHASNFNQQTSYSWTVPAGVTAIHAVSVGGGGGGEANHDGASGCGGALAYKNNISVNPGETITVYVGGGGRATSWGNNSQNGQSSYITVGGSNFAVAGGGTGGDQNGTSNDWITNNNYSSSGNDGGGAGGSGIHYGGCRMSGGGAGGYNGGGGTSSGRAGNNPYWGVQPQQGQAGGGGGGTSANGSTNYYSAGGGGTGVYGQGSNGDAGGYNSSPNDELDFCGKGGSTAFNTGLRGYSMNSSASNWAAGSDLGNGYDRAAQANAYGVGGNTTPDGGFPGGGGGGGNSGHACGHGAHGMVRIMYGTISGNARSFPSTYASRTDQYASGVTETVYGSQKMY
tara:strand:+ start:6454 stop:8121 length:1668 start_codon:yes stop_codon:yes gene_type:complete